MSTLKKPLSSGNYLTLRDVKLKGVALSWESLCWKPPRTWIGGQEKEGRFPLGWREAEIC
jgi:hypothetical protein